MLWASENVDVHNDMVGSLGLLSLYCDCKDVAGNFLI